MYTVSDKTQRQAIRTARRFVREARHGLAVMTEFDHKINGDTGDEQLTIKIAHPGGDDHDRQIQG